MRWRLFIFCLSVTSVFCFMLLTAVTDHGGQGGHPHLSAGTAQPLLSSSVSVPASPSSPMSRRDGGLHVLPAAKFDIRVKPSPARVFVSRESDPVREAHEASLGTKGTKGPKQRNRLKRDGHGWYREEHALVTAYCPCVKCCGTHSPGITSIGKNAWTSGLAADPLRLEYGTRVYVPEYGLSTIDDTGGAMRRHWRQNGILHIDVRMTYHYEARQWGKRYERVKIYDEE